MVGSIFLAAVLLKLGGFGMLIFQGFLATPSRVSLLTSIRGVGAVGVAALCCQTLDLKVLIAFTSVGHMALVVIGAALGTHLRATVSVLVLLRHGFSSSLGFFMAFVLYKLTGSRSLLINKSLIGAAGLLIGLWVFIVLALIGCPPAINVWVEMSAFYIFLADAARLIKCLGLIALIRGVYGFILAGKVVGYCDLIFKLCGQATNSALLHAFYSVLLTCLTVRLIAALLF